MLLQRRQSVSDAHIMVIKKGPQATGDCGCDHLGGMGVGMPVLRHAPMLVERDGNHGQIDISKDT